MQLSEKELRQFIRKRIEALSEEAGISARDLSLSIDKGETYINGITTGRYSPKVNALNDLCRHFGIELSDFFDQQVRSPKRAKSIARMLEMLLDESELTALESYLKNLSQEQIKAILVVIQSFHHDHS